MVAVYAGVFTALFSAGVVGRGKKNVEAAPVVPAVAVAGVAAAVAGGGGGASGGAGESAADTRERMEVDGSKMVKASLFFSQSKQLPGVSRYERSSGKNEPLGTLAVAFDIEPGWHTYWQNAGDSGMPPSFEFTVEPAGAVEIGKAQWPVPQRHVAEGDILDYIYEGRVLHLFEVQADVGLETMVPITVTCKITWLVCKEACLPGEGEVKTTLKIALEPEKQPETASDEEIAKWAAALPASKSGVFTTKWDKGVLEVAAVQPGRITFFPYAEEGDLVPINLVKSGESNSGTLRLHFDPDQLKSGGRVRGLVQIGGDASERASSAEAYQLEIPVPKRTE